MPLYEYQCDECGRRLERIQKFSDPPLTECPDCRGLLRKLLSSPAIQFKGSGWYITDYARAEKPTKDGAEKPTKDGAETAAKDAKDAKKPDAGSSASSSSSEKSTDKAPAATAPTKGETG